MHSSTEHDAVVPGASLSDILQLRFFCFQQQADVERQPASGEKGKISVCQCCLSGLHRVAAASLSSVCVCVRKSACARPFSHRQLTAFHIAMCRGALRCLLGVRRSQLVCLEMITI